jgi:hypothetical protein
MQTFAQRFLFAVLCTVLSTVAMHSTSYAKECEGGNCKAIKIYNYTDYKHELQFLLCCNYELKKTDCYTVPVGESKIEFSDGCTIVKWGFCARLTPRICYKYDETDCVLKIFYCD